MHHGFFGFVTHPELDDGDQVLNAVVIRNRYRDAAACRDPLDRRLDVVGRVVAPVDNQEVLDSTDDEQLALGEEARISGPQPRTFGGVLRRVDNPRTERALSLFGFVPISGSHVAAVHPNLAGRTVGTLNTCVRVDNAYQH